MKKALSLWQFAGFVFTVLLGSLLHFVYDWSGQSIFVAPFSAVNESTWEHMKLLFFPMFIFALIQRRFLQKDYENFWCVKLAGILVGLILIPVLFYTYRGVFGTSPDIVNIAIFFAAAAFAYWVETLLFKQARGLCVSPAAAFFAIILIAVAFVAFTFSPPEIPLFQDPVTMRYGLGK